MKTILRITFVAPFAAALLLATAAVTAQVETGPAGDIPDNQAFVTFRGSGYSLEAPEGWSRTQRAASVTFSDKYNSIRADLSRVAKRPTMSSVAKTELARLKATIKGFAQPKVTSVTRLAGNVVLVTYTATSPPNAVTGKSVTNDGERYEFWKGGKLVVLTLQAPRGSDNVDPWKRVTDSFTWK